MSEKKRKPRKPRVGEYYVFHDDPRYVYVVETVYAETLRVQNCVTLQFLDDTIKHFHEFHTRVPI